jgi:hypothetical protein
MTKFLSLITLILLAGSRSCQIILFGGCPQNIRAIDSFDLNQVGIDMHDDGFYSLRGILILMFLQVVWSLVRDITFF